MRSVSTDELKIGKGSSSSEAAVLRPALIERVLTQLGFARQPEPTLEGLSAIYGAWCQKVPFDNVRKIIHVRAGDAGPLPGSRLDEFFEAWLKHGTGGTCWSGNGSFCALLQSLGFDSVRGVATMLAAPDIPPNHGTVMVKFGEERYLVDCSIMHVEPLRLLEDEETGVTHPAWGVRCFRKEGKWFVAWRPLHKVDGFECRFERFGATAGEFFDNYDKTRGWSPFNYEVTARKNVWDTVVGVSFGHAVTLRNDGQVDRVPVSRDERDKVLIEKLGLSEEIVSQLPPDVPTPPPPGSRTAEMQAQAG